MNYSVFRKVKPILNNNINNEHISNFLGGCVAGAISILSTYPLETTRTYLSLQTNFLNLWEHPMKYPYTKY